MKIGIDARMAIRNYHGPLGHYTIPLIRFLQALDQVNEYRLFWPDDEYRELTPERLEVFNGLQKENNDYWENLHLPCCIDKESIDLIHLVDNGLGFPIEKKCPVVITLHHLLPYFFPELINKKDLKKVLDSMPLIMENCDTIIALTQSLKKELGELMDIPEKKIVVTTPAPDPIYTVLEREQARAKVSELFGLEKEFILHTGGFGRGKNLKRLLISFYLVRKDFSKPYQLVLTGYQSEEWEELLPLVSALNLENQVTFLDNTEAGDLLYLYNGAQACVFPAFYEGYPFEAVEAMACGVPICASAIPANQETIGEAGILVNPYDTINIAEGLYQVAELEDRTGAMVSKGLSKVKGLSWAQTAADTLAIYRSAAKEK